MRTHRKATRREVMRHHARTAAAATARGDWRAAELHAAAWHGLNTQTDAEHAVSGLTKRIAARAARVPLDERMSMGKEKISP